MNPAYYRVRLLFDVWQSLLLPVLLLRLVLFWLKISTSSLYFAFLAGASILLWATAKTSWNTLGQYREIKALNARPIPCVVGRWPGNLDILLRMMKGFKTSYILDVYLQLFEEYQCTTLNLRILWRDSIISMDQEHTKYVLAMGFQRFWRGHAQKERLETFLGTGIFNRDDEVSVKHRNMARPFFARERVEDFENFEAYTARTLSILTTLSTSDEAFDAQDLYARFTLDSASEFLFGKNLDTLSQPRPLAGKARMGPKGSALEGSWGSFAHSFETAQINATTRARIGHWWPLLELTKDINKEHADVIHSWMDPLVETSLSDRGYSTRRSSKDLSGTSFLQYLAETTKNPITIRDQLLNMLLASRDTTATTLTFLTYILAIRPDVADRLRQEVLEFCGPTSAPTYERIKKMKYLRAVLNETLRLFPAVPLNVRESRTSSNLFPASDPTYPQSDARPLYIPKHTTFMFFPLLTQRNKALWGEDADDFDPDRWIDPQRIAKFVGNPAMFLPFSAGPRICLGQNFAYNQMSYFVVRLLQRFDRFTLTPEFQPKGSLPPPEWKTRKGRQAEEQVWPAAALTLFIKGGLWVKCHLA
ncbi:cytochrome P450 monooxygenase CYP63, partial [Coprinopsis sp. MPI-PUGE-AT-0042]